MIKLAISGCMGRMGQSIYRLASEDKTFSITTLLEHKDHPQVKETIGHKKIDADNTSLKGCDVLIEFTTPEATITNLQACLDYNIKMAIGTTGFTSDQTKIIQQASENIPIVFASNMSVGVNILFKLTQLVAGKTGSEYSIHITEAHHVHKKDAPSGTAKSLAELAEKSSGEKVKDIRSIREGEIIGNHDIIFESGEDIIKIGHYAKNRDIFAKGALVAAKFLKDQTTGLYTMQDVLGLN